jgi:hypothetical protein
MNGIGGKPYISAEHLIDMSGIIALEKEICYGIARSEVLAGIYGPGIKDSHIYGNFLSCMHKFNIDDNISMEERKTFNSLTRNQKSLFFKLYNGLYSASTTVYLRTFKEEGLNSYLGKSKADKTIETDNAKYFPNLMKWISALPFAEIGRVLFFLHEHDCKLLVHRDGVKYTPHKNEFLWINPCGVKSFFIYDEEKDIEHVVDSKAVFFNDLDMHGGHPNSKLTWSLRIDGVFKDEFRRQLGIDHLTSY